MFPTRAIHSHVEYCLLEGKFGSGDNSSGGGGGDGSSVRAAGGGGSGGSGSSMSSIFISPLNVGEFEELPLKETTPQELPPAVTSSKHLNRYLDILPTPATRVILQLRNKGLCPVTHQRLPPAGT